MEGVVAHFDHTESLSTGKYRPSPEVWSVWAGHGTDDKCTWFDKTKEWLESLDIEGKIFWEYTG